MGRGPLTDPATEDPATEDVITIPYMLSPRRLLLYLISFECIKQHIGFIRRNCTLFYHF